MKRSFSVPCKKTNLPFVISMKHLMWMKNPSEGNTACEKKQGCWP